MRRTGDRLGNRYEFTWRRPHRLKVSGKVPATLAVKTSAIAGVTALTLYAGSSLALEGDLFQDTVMTLGGTDYTLSADAVAANSEISVEFTPILDAPASVDDVATLSGAVDKTLRSDGASLWGNYESLELHRIEPGSFGTRGFAWRLPKNGAPWTPRPGHRIKIDTLDLEGSVEVILAETAALWVLGVSAA